MTLLWADGFDHYGLDESNMLDGVYASVDGSLSTAQVATGTHAFAVDNPGGLSSFDGLRKVLPAARDKLGAMGRFYFPQLPTANYQAGIFHFLPSDSTARSQLTVSVGINGELHFIRNGQMYTNNAFTDGGGVVVATTDPIIVASAYNHIEVQVYIHDTLGWVRAAVNGIHKYLATGLDTKGSGSSSTCTSIAQCLTYNFNTGATYYFDDYIIYDFNGVAATYTDWCPTVDGSGVATNYMGEWEAYRLQPNGDTAEADWGKSSGTVGYSLVDEADPNDAGYISSLAAGDLSEFALADLPVDITVIRGLMLIGRMSKSDSGPAMIKFGMKSVAAVSDAAERPITVEPTYWWDFINVDPNSGSRWTRASLNAAWMRLTRSL